MAFALSIDSTSHQKIGNAISGPKPSPFIRTKKIPVSILYGQCTRADAPGGYRKDNLEARVPLTPPQPAYLVLCWPNCELPDTHVMIGTLAKQLQYTCEDIARLSEGFPIARPPCASFVLRGVPLFLAGECPERKHARRKVGHGRHKVKLHAMLTRGANSY